MAREVDTSGAFRGSENSHRGGKPLFDSLTNKMKEYPELRQLIYRLLFQGQSIVFNPDDYEIRMALMFGFVKIKDGFVLIANRIFEKWRFGCPSDFGKICPLFS